MDIPEIVSASCAGSYPVMVRHSTGIVVIRRNDLTSEDWAFLAGIWPETAVKMQAVMTLHNVSPLPMTGYIIIHIRLEEDVVWDNYFVNTRTCMLYKLTDNCIMKPLPYPRHTNLDTVPSCMHSLRNTLN